MKVKLKLATMLAAAALVLPIFVFAPNGAASASTPSGTPIKIGTIVPVGGAISFPDVRSAIQAGILGVNKAGGVHGRPLQFIFCNEGGNPNTATACARTLVSDGVVATIGLFSPTAGPQVADILGQAGIAQIASIPFTTAEFNNPSIFALSGGTAFDYVGCELLEAKQGHKKIYLVNYNLGAASTGTIDQLKASAEKVGAQVVGSSVIPLESPDFDPVVGDIEQSGANAVIAELTGAATVQLIQDETSLGATATVCQNGSAYTKALYNELGQAANGLLVSVRVPPFTAAAQYPQIKTFEANLKAEAASGDSESVLSNMNELDEEVWLGTQAFSKIGDLITGPITAASVIHELRTAKDIDLGLIPPWTPNKQGIPGYSHVSNSYLYFVKVENGTEHLLTPKPVNVAKDVVAPSS